MPNYRTYRIVFVGREFYQVFEEVALALQHSLESLGYSCDFSLERAATDRMNILLGAHYMKEVPRGIPYIVYQLEPLQQQNTVYCERVRQILLHAQDVWDYLPENITFLQTQGIAAKYLPIGYHPKLQLISQDQPKDIDLLFYGWLTPRRVAYFEGFRNRGIKNFQAHCMLFGAQRDALIARSRVVLSIHQHPDLRTLSATRAAYLLNNGCFFISETCASNPYSSINLQFGSLDELIAMAQHFAAHPAEAQNLGLQWQEQFKRDYPMVDLLLAVL